MKYWPRRILRPMRCNDLRGPAATLLARRGVGLVVPQRILRHRSAVRREHLQQSGPGEPAGGDRRDWHPAERTTLTKSAQAAPPKSGTPAILLSARTWAVSAGRAKIAPPLTKNTS